MSAQNAKAKKGGILDSLVDFGPDTSLYDIGLSAPTEAEAQRRIRNIVKQMEELNRRIDSLLNSR